MKGVELPINVLVVVAIAVIVLLGLIGLYFAGFIPGAGTISLASAKNSACAQLIQRGCGTTLPYNISAAGYDANGDGTYLFNNTTGDNLQVLCEKQFAVSVGDQRTCKKDVCGCTGL